MLYMQYWINVDTGKVIAREFDDKPYGKLWMEITEEEYNSHNSPLSIKTENNIQETDAEKTS